jgi:hypothetical protein
MREVRFFWGPRTERMLYARSRGLLTADSLAELERRRADLLAQISQLSDFRPGSITSTQGRCGNPQCHCHNPGEPGHGPNFRLTYRVEGKPVTKSLATRGRGRDAGCPAPPHRPVLALLTHTVPTLDNGVDRYPTRAPAPSHAWPTRPARSPVRVSTGSSSSGRAMARTGLADVSIAPLKFRTAGFPQYGFKAGISDEAFPANWFAIVPWCSLRPSLFPVLCPGRCGL